MTHCPDCITKGQKNEVVWCRHLKAFVCGACGTEFKPNPQLGPARYEAKRIDKSRYGVEYYG